MNKLLRSNKTPYLPPLSRALCHKPVHASMALCFNISDLGKLLCVSRTFKEHFSKEFIWEATATRIKLEQGPISLVRSYVAVRMFTQARIADKSKEIVSALGRMQPDDMNKLDFSNSALSMRSGSLSVPDDVTYRILVDFVRNNREILRPYIKHFIELAPIEIATEILLGDDISSKSRANAILELCRKGHEALVPKYRPDLLAVDERTSLVGLGQCKGIRELLLKSGACSLPAEEEAPEFLKAIYPYHKLDEIQKISSTLTDRDRGQTIIDILREIRNEEELDGIYLMLQSGGIEIGEREQIMQLACDKGFEALFRNCIGMGWGVSNGNRNLFIIGIAKSGNMKMLLELFRDAIPTLDQGTRGLAIAEAARRGDDIMVARLMPREIAPSDRTNCVIQALRNKHFRLAYTLLHSGIIGNHETVIVEAARAGALEILKSYSDFSNVRDQAIWAAIESGSVESLKFFSPMTEKERDYFVKLAFLIGSDEVFKFMLDLAPISYELCLYIIQSYTYRLSPGEEGYVRVFDDIIWERRNVKRNRFGVLKLLKIDQFSEMERIDLLTHRGRLHPLEAEYIKNAGPMTQEGREKFLLEGSKSRYRLDEECLKLLDLKTMRSSVRRECICNYIRHTEIEKALFVLKQAPLDKEDRGSVELCIRETNPVFNEPYDLWWKQTAQVCLDLLHGVKRTPSSPSNGKCIVQ